MILNIFLKIDSIIMVWIIILFLEYFNEVWCLGWIYIDMWSNYCNLFINSVVLSGVWNGYIKFMDILSSF